MRPLGSLPACGESSVGQVSRGFYGRGARLAAPRLAIRLSARLFLIGGGGAGHKWQVATPY